MAYDRARGVVVLYGGGYANTSDPCLLTGFRSDLWEWDGSSWTQRSQGGDAPGGLSAHSMAFDEVTQKVIVFGGVRPTGKNNDTYIWDGTSHNWIKVSAPALLTGRYFVGLCSDPIRNRVVMYGGLTVPGSLLSQTWEWNGSAWNQAFPSNNPGNLYSPALSFDYFNSKALLFNSHASSITLQNPWYWDGTQWNIVSGSHGFPSPDGFGVCSSESYRKRVVHVSEMYIDTMNNPVPSETSVWDGVLNWEKYTGTNPTSRSDFAMAYDESRHEYVLFGGRSAMCSLLSDTWTFKFCDADFDGDCFVTGDDFDAYVDAFGNADPGADFDRDGFVTGDDFDQYSAAFEAGC